MTPPVAGADFLAAFVASCLRGAFPPVDLRAVCFVRAILFVGSRVVGSRCLAFDQSEQIAESQLGVKIMLKIWPFICFRRLLFNIEIESVRVVVYK